MKRFAIYLLLLSVVARVRAWGPEGHEIVGRIAELHLTPAAARAASEILNGTNDTTHFRIANDGVANWADRVRKQRPESAPWHFVDIPFGATGYETQRDCTAHQGCVIEAIARFQKELTDSQVTFVGRNEALRFLVHFVGDIHQPLHCAERNGDKGGNLCNVLWPGNTTPARLHGVWDGNILRKTLADQKLDPPAYAEKLNSSITPAQATEWKRGTPTDWANAAHRLAVEKVYESIPTDGPPVTLSEKYIAQSQRIVDEQLIKGGVRLAELLNGTLK